MSLEMKYTFEINIDFRNKVIDQRLINEKKDVLIRWICDTREETVKDALIKLGWKPPDNE